MKPKEILGAALHSQKDILQRLEALVRIESPSEEKTAVDQISQQVAAWMQEMGGRVRWHRQRKFGDLLEVRFAPQKKDRDRKDLRPLMVLGHLDTVWPMGTLARMPWRVKDGKAFGPGVYDMKAGVVMAMTAIRLLLDAEELATPVILLLTSEEEIGSICSRVVIEKLAQECSAVFVLEPAQGQPGAYKTARKGVGQYQLHVDGVAAHSGVDFEKGHSAIVELAGLIERVAGFTDLKTGLTVNPGVVRGGTRSNVVAAAATADVDVRIARMRDNVRVEKMFRSLRVRDKACTLQVTGGINRPPMERGQGTIKLFQKAQELAGEMGLSLTEASTGGGSDGNFTAALGIPTLDGMGAVGEGAHAKHESVIIKQLPERTALLAAMIAAHTRK
ncbi:MAG TPA: M20 family metallopeptidase [Acidobacteriaceae bacterium]|nr:M20 family metallopeptidase [Acidobacteriaceae bacterium]